MKIALVTGASRGLGKEIARILGERGFTVWSPGRDQMDVGSQLAIAKQVTYATHHLGLIDVVINNAAILSNNLADSITVNAMGAYHVTRLFWPRLTKPGARVINISSREGLTGDAAFGARPYSVSKSALNAIARMQSNNNDGVTVCACCPGWFASRLGGDKTTRTAADAADTPVWLATEAPDDLNGQFVSNRTVLPW